jgi:hypothetical protein
MLDLFLVKQTVQLLKSVLAKLSSQGHGLVGGGAKIHNHEANKHNRQAPGENPPPADPGDSSY